MQPARGSVRFAAVAGCLLLGAPDGTADLGDKVTLSLQENPVQVARAEIDAAAESIDVVVYKFDERVLRKALERAIERGVRVRILADLDEARSKGSEVQRVQRAGARVALWRRGKLHAKFTIIDGKRVLTGSYNWTASASESNVELLVDLGNPDDVKQFEQAFETLWGIASGQGG